MAEITNSAFEPASMMAKCDPRHGKVRAGAAAHLTSLLASCLFLPEVPRLLQHCCTSRSSAFCKTC